MNHFHDLDNIGKSDVLQTLIESEHQLSLIYNSAIDPMWLIQVEGPNQFRFMNINSSFTDVTGLKWEQVVGLMMEEVLPATSHQLVRDKYNEAIITGKVVDYIEVAVHPAGEKVGEIRVIPVKDQDGDVTQLVGIANDITEKRSLQRRLDMEREMASKRITAAALQGQEMERNNLSRELHDNVNQVLTTVKLYTELCASGSADVDLLLPKCTQLLNDTINEIRSLTKQLAAPPIRTLGLAESLKELIASLRLTQTVSLTLDLPPAECESIEEDLQLTTYRIAQEHFTNILKHAKATTVNVKVACSSTNLTLTIVDDGVGFDTTQTPGGIGITNMHSRASLYNGVLEIKSVPGNGSVLHLSFPVKNVEGTCGPISADGKPCC